VPRMPKYAKIQNARNRKYTRSGVTFFNSPFGLWLLSAIFLTVGGATLSARNECLASARSDIESYKRVSDEILERRIRLMIALRQSSNAIDFQKAMRSKAHANFKEFDGQGFRALVDQQAEIASRFALSRQTSEKLQKLVALTPIKRAVDVIMQGGTDTTATAFVEAVISDDEVKASQKEWPNRLGSYVTLGAFERNLQLEPACSFWRLAARTIFEDYKTVVEAPRPDIVFGLPAIMPAGNRLVDLFTVAPIRGRHPHNWIMNLRWDCQRTIERLFGPLPPTIKGIHQENASFTRSIE
jgi:hypothetical protein